MGLFSCGKVSDACMARSGLAGCRASAGFSAWCRGPARTRFWVRWVNSKLCCTDDPDAHTRARRRRLSDLPRRRAARRRRGRGRGAARPPSRAYSARRHLGAYGESEVIGASPHQTSSSPQIRQSSELNNHVHDYSAEHCAASRSAHLAPRRQADRRAQLHSPPEVPSPLEVLALRARLARQGVGRGRRWGASVLLGPRATPLPSPRVRT